MNERSPDMPLDTALNANAVTATLNYLRRTPDQAERPHSFAYAPKNGMPRTNMVAEPHELPIHDIHAEDRAFSLNREGFTVVTHQSAVTDFANETQIRDLYYPEAERLLK